MSRVAVPGGPGAAPLETAVPTTPANAPGRAALVPKRRQHLGVHLMNRTPFPGAPDGAPPKTAAPTGQPTTPATPPPPQTTHHTKELAS